MLFKASNEFRRRNTHSGGAAANDTAPFLVASGLMVTAKHTDWPGLRRPKAGATEHSSSAAPRSNRQRTPSPETAFQQTLSSPLALSSTICRGKEGREESRTVNYPRRESVAVFVMRW